jgi:hypothetical protein
MATDCRTLCDGNAGLKRRYDLQQSPPQMLPLPLQFIIAMVAYAINEHMARRSKLPVIYLIPRMDFFETQHT